jgi:hypothetical protein
MSRHLVVGVFAAVLWTAAPVSAQYRFEKGLELQPGGRLILDTDEGDVTVVGDDSGDARIGVFARYGNFRISTDSTPVATRIRVQRRESWLEWLLLEWWPRERDTKLRVRVPRMTDVRIRTAGGSIRASRLVGTLDVSTNGGGVHVGGVDGAVRIHTGGGPVNAWDLAGDLIAQSSGGEMTIARVRGSVNVHTGGGPILVNSATGRVYVSTSGGRVAVRAAGDRVDAHSGGGPVSVTFARGNRAGGNLSSSGGRVVARVDPSVPLTVDAEAAGGRVATYIPVTTHAAFNGRRLTGEVNGGGSLLRLRSSGGPVEIAAIRVTDLGPGTTDGPGTRNQVPRTN